ncbi:MAG TPA: dephospho-CoA kinase, long form [Candidatus Agrococcus pullicola]|uniref:Dephospho-CoA kinase n=1 Tax=Candidatus Agrococcus pullicola TaxID=2838429 RepID=A0A9D1YUK1_9MICO|nr:dephospho-CoA kinase, long form [Candidatus Agrococcus pullicola]
MTLIGLTGGIAAGKSTVAERFREHGAYVLDADQQARDVVAPGSPALEGIRARFGEDVVDADGRLDRAKLGSIVFAEEGARSDLEAITHPAIRDLTEERIAEIRQRDPDAVVVYDVPLLVEANVQLPFAAVVVVHAAAAERLRRLVELRGMSREEAERRIGSQATDEERLAIADYVVDADGSLDATIRDADRVWRELTART